MAWTIESALSDELIGNSLRLISEYRFTLGDIPRVITVRLYEPISGGGVLFRQSHFIKTPIQAGPYMTSSPWNDDEASALRQVVFGFTDNYNGAVRRGHRPDISWLVSNEDF